jgi:hypothetical protein
MTCLPGDQKWNAWSCETPTNRSFARPTVGSHGRWRPLSTCARGIRGYSLFGRHSPSRTSLASCPDTRFARISQGRSSGPALEPRQALPGGSWRASGPGDVCEAATAACAGGGTVSDSVPTLPISGTGPPLGSTVLVPVRAVKPSSCTDRNGAHGVALYLRVSTEVRRPRRRRPNAPRYPTCASPDAEETSGSINTRENAWVSLLAFWSCCLR